MPIKTYFCAMLKQWIYLSLISAIIFLSACGAPKKITNEAEEENTTTTVTPKTEIQYIYKFDTVIKENNFYTKITPNYSYRKPNYVIIHHTAQDSCEQTFFTFSLARTGVSSHYVICEDGTITQLVDDYLRAWHAGNSRWGNTTDINSTSIGIELDNNGTESFKKPQLDSLEALLARLKEKHGIPTANFIGHGDIAPSRKNDPNVTFPWERFAVAGFGLWYDKGQLAAAPANLDIVMALRIIGYDVRNADAAITAFNRHFMQLNNVKELNDLGKRRLFNLMNKYLLLEK
jgi:N-acetylmuramoyl-L-alanine amidase